MSEIEWAGEDVAELPGFRWVPVPHQVGQEPGRLWLMGPHGGVGVVWRQSGKWQGRIFGWLTATPRREDREEIKAALVREYASTRPVSS